MMIRSSPGAPWPPRFAWLLRFPASHPAQPARPARASAALRRTLLRLRSRAYTPMGPCTPVRKSPKLCFGLFRTHDQGPQDESHLAELHREGVVGHGVQVLDVEHPDVAQQQIAEAVEDEPPGDEA